MARATRKTVREKVSLYWLDQDSQEIMAVLDAYGAESSERGRARVQLAILKLSERRRDRLPRLVQMAKTDYRDVLACAEYPEEMRTGFVEMRRLSKAEAQAIRQRDREQYRAWLEESCRPRSITGEDR
jgi:hypothetical protein